jgi:hypothetical protein
MDSILKREVERYVNQFGCPQVLHTLGQPFFNAELNKIPTAIFPVRIVNGENVEIDNFDYFKEQLKNSNKIIRLEVKIEEYQVVSTKVIIVADLVSRKLAK